jgi:hypothetical protein
VRYACKKRDSDIFIVRTYINQFHSYMTPHQYPIR